MAADWKMPLHLQLYELLKEKIEAHTFAPGSMIPSERELSTQYELNRMTVRGALRLLVEEGYLRTIHGKGTFVSGPKFMRDLEEMKGFSQALREKGIKPSDRLVYREVLPAGTFIASRLGVSPADQVVRLVRLRSGNGTPIAIEEAFVPSGLIPELMDLDLHVISLYEAFELHGIHPERAVQTLSMVQVSGGEAKLLKLADGDSVFRFEAQSFDSQDRCIEFVRSLTRPNTCSFRAELIRSQP
ncbi:MAG TPA: GntR family transcriptional regulator [Holophaga sp.]|nr:GntR family transcriptional regulator [Holophaga sp.]